MHVIQPLIVAILLILVTVNVHAAGGEAKVEYQVGERLKTQPGSASARYQEVTWDDLIPPEWDPLREFKNLDLNLLQDSDPRAMDILDRLKSEWDNAPVRTSLDGKLIRIAGFVVPLEANAKQLREFLLVPYFGACIHVPPPPANNTVHVVLDSTVKNVGSMDAVWVSGQIKVERADTEWGVAGYRLEGQRVDPYQESKKR